MIISDYQNNYTERSNMILQKVLTFLFNVNNYLNDPTKLFLDLYLTKFLDTLAHTIPLFL